MDTIELIETYFTRLKKFHREHHRCVYTINKVNYEQSRVNERHDNNGNGNGLYQERNIDIILFCNVTISDSAA